MITNNDQLQLKAKNITEKQVNEQLARFINGFPYLEIKEPATVGKGIMRMSDDEIDAYISRWDAYTAGDRQIVKFVPASGAASRMFKELFEFIDAPYDTPETANEKKFFDNIHNFAFSAELNFKCNEILCKSIDELIAEKQYKKIAEALIEDWGLNYGSSPKGIITFHSYPDGNRAAIDEHFVEGAMYAANADKTVNIHFTISSNDAHPFTEMAGKAAFVYGGKFGVKFNLSISTQQPGTDTIAVDMANAPLRDNKGRLVFRPGGHGSLLHNLNEIDADVVFIKNIDNVVPDRLKPSTVRYKKALAGVLIALQEQIFEYIRLIESGSYTHEQVENMIHFVQNTLCIKNPELKYLEDAELVLYIKSKLMRPIRVCGMVKNDGEPGGGPFFAVNSDGTVSLQIVESSQVDMNNLEAKKTFMSGSHFNPVDLVCALKDVNGKKYNLPDYVDENTGFISAKSKNGRELKALEHPGLWNGSMSDWTTVFVETPIETFNPVKTVNDLLRPQHQ